MADILVRDVSAEDLDRLTRRAAELGLSRNEYLRRRLADLANDERRVTVEDFRRSAHLARDLLDEDVMRGAWE